jgi:DNA replication protein DnaC
VTNDAALASLELTTRSLRLPTVKRVGPHLADEATRRHQTHLDFLAAVLLCEVDDRDERRRLRRVKAAGFPRTKLLADFDVGESDALAGLAKSAEIVDLKPLADTTRTKALSNE